MSYCRFGEHSDVYMYASSAGIECCGCLLDGGPRISPTSKVEDRRFQKASKALAHLEAHRAAGHEVPDYAEERLRDEALCEVAGHLWQESIYTRPDGHLYVTRVGCPRCGEGYVED